MITVSRDTCGLQSIADSARPTNCDHLVRLEEIGNDHDVPAEIGVQFQYTEPADDLAARRPGPLESRAIADATAAVRNLMPMPQ